MALQLKMDPTQIVAGSAKAETALDGVKAAAVQAESAVDRLGKTAPAMAPLAAGADRAAAASGRLAIEAANVQRTGFAAGGGMRMLGQQLSQVAQQGAVTGNYLGALAVQLPDMALGFGSAAIAASIVATVTLPLLISAFGNGKTAADNMADAQDRLESSLGALRDISTELGNLDQLRAKYGEVDDRLLGLIASQRTFAITSAQSAARDAIAALADEYAVASGQMNLFKITGKGAAADIAEELGLSKWAMIGFQDAIRDAQTATTFEEQADALARVDGYLQRSTISADEVAGNVTKAALEMLALDKAASDSGDSIAYAKGEGSELNKAIVDAGIAMNTLVQSAPGGGWLSGAIADASTLAARLWDGARAAQIARMGDQPALTGPAGMGSSPPTGGAVMTSLVPRSRGVDSVAFGDSGTGSSGGGGGGAAIDRTREAYDRLMSSLDPVVARTQDMAEATKTADAALAAHDITAAEHARALDLIRDKYAETAGAMGDLRDVGGTAIDSLINGTKTLSDALKQMAKDLIFATIKAQLLKSVTGATGSMTLGGIIMQGITGGFHDAGGTIPAGTTGMVGERGPELVRATSSGAVVTSRVDTARQMQGAQAMHVTVGVSVDDEGNLKAYVKRMSQAAAQSGAGQAVQTVKRSLSTWNSQLSTDGALA